MRQAAVIGIGANDFWTMTPRWLLPLLEAWHEHRQQALRFDVTIAWLNAAWPRAKRMPSLDKTLAQLGLGMPRKMQTQAEMQTAAQQWVAHMAAHNARNGGGTPAERVFVPPSLERLKTQGSA